MEEGTLRANVIEAKVNNVSVRYERPRNGESDNEIYSQGEVVPAEKIISAAGFKVGFDQIMGLGFRTWSVLTCCWRVFDQCVDDIRGWLQGGRGGHC